MMTSVYFGPCQDEKAAVSALLRRALQDWSLPDTPLLHDPAGRPYLPGGPCVSLSHTRGLAALALSDAPVGVDIERFRTLSPRLPKRTLSPPEYQWFWENGSQCADFFTLWTLKESYYKYRGTGLPGIPNQTEFLRENGRWRLSGSDLFFWTEAGEDFAAALCGETAEIRVIWTES